MDGTSESSSPWSADQNKSPWLADQADSKLVDLAVSLTLEGRDEATVRQEIGRRGITGVEQDAVVANVSREIGKRRAAFDRDTRNAMTRSQVLIGLGLLAATLAVVLAIVLGRISVFGLLFPSAVFLGLGIGAYRSASRRSFP